MGIKEIRRKRNMTQKELADAVGVNFTVISKYESGQVTPPANRLEAIANVLGVKIDALLGDDVDIASRRRTFIRPVDEDKYYAADSLAADYVLKKSNGICELCGKEAPFKDKNGDPYLEAHYVKWLSEGGRPEIANVVALCPNCHQKIHVQNLPEDIEKLKVAADKHK